MLITVDIKSFLAEAATAASVQPSPDSVDTTRRAGNILALAGRYAS
jgi:hypothetical protein